MDIQDCWFYKFQQDFGMQLPLTEIQPHTAFGKLKYLDSQLFIFETK